MPIDLIARALVDRLSPSERPDPKQGGFSLDAPSISSRQNSTNVQRPEALVPGVLQDVNRNGQFDFADVFSVPDLNGSGTIDPSDVHTGTNRGQDGVSFVRPEYRNVDPRDTARTIIGQNRGMDFLVLGERHGQADVGLIDAFFAELKASGRPFAVPYEMRPVPESDFVAPGDNRPLKESNPNEYYALQNLVDSYNTGNISAQEFEDDVNEIFRNHPYYSQIYGGSETAATLASAARHGALEITLIDTSPDEATRTNFEEAALDGRSASVNPFDVFNRDEHMTRETLAMRERLPPGIVLAMPLGLEHSTDRAPGVTDPARADPNEPGVDYGNPVATRLAKAFGGEAVVTVGVNGLVQHANTANEVFGAASNVDRDLKRGVPGRFDYYIP